MRELLFSLTKRDFRIDTFRGTGAGGQKRNKTESGVRITHVESGAVASSDQTRSQHENKKIAFSKLIELPAFKNYMRTRIARETGRLAQIDEAVDYEMEHNTKVEYYTP